MIQAYAVGVSLTLDSNVAAGVGEAITQFDLLRQNITKAQTALNELASGMRALRNVGGSAASDWTKAANAMRAAAGAATQAGKAMGSTGAPYTPNFTMPGYVPPASQSQPGTPPTLPGPRAPRMNYPIVAWNGGGSGMIPPGANPYAGNGIVPQGYNFGPPPINLPPLPPTPPPPRPGAHDFAMAAVGYGLVGRALTGFYGDVVGAGMDTGSELYKLRAQQFTDDEVKRAYQTAKDAQRDIPGVTVGGALEAQRDLALVMRNPDSGLPNAEEITKALPDFLRMATVLSAFGKGGELSGLLDAVRQGELKGMINSPQDLSKLLALNEYLTMRTGGRVGPAEILQYMRSGGAAAQGLSLDEQFSTAVPLILSMGAARAGVGLRGFYQQFNAGKESDAAVNMLIDMGMIMDPENPGMVLHEHIKPGSHGGPLADYKAGIGQYHLPADVLPGWKMLNEGHEFEWIEKVLLPKIQEYNKSYYGFDNVNLESSTGVSLASRIPGGNMLADMFRLWPMIQGYRASYETEKNDPTTVHKSFDLRMADDPTLKMKALEAAWNGFLVSLANGPVMDTATKVLMDLTGGLNAMGKWADEHPTMAATLVNVAGGLGALAVAIGSVSAALFLAGPMLRVGGWALRGGAPGLAGGLPGLAVAGADAVANAAGAPSWTTNILNGAMIGGTAGSLFGGVGFLPGAVAGGIGGALWGLDPFHGTTTDDLMRHVGPFGGASAAPPAAPATTNLEGNVYLDGSKVGTVIASDHASNLSLPPSGPTGPDPRMNLRMPGMGNLPDFGP